MRKDYQLEFSVYDTQKPIGEQVQKVMVWLRGKVQIRELREYRKIE